GDTPAWPGRRGLDSAGFARRSAGGTGGRQRARVYQVARRSDHHLAHAQVGRQGHVEARCASQCPARPRALTVSRTPPPNPLPEAERGRKTAATSFRGEQVEQPRLFPFCSPSPLRGGGWGEGFCKQGTGCWDWSCTAPVCYDRSGELDGTRRGILFYFRSG